MALLGLSWLQTAPSRVAVVSPVPPPAPDDIGAGGVRSCSSFYRAGRPRGVVYSIEKFGGVGDGKTSNTEAFRRAMDHLRKFGAKGGSQLNVPKGRWVTGSFNVTSNFTLFLEKGAVILGSQVFLWNSFEYIYKNKVVLNYTFGLERIKDDIAQNILTFKKIYCNEMILEPCFCNQFMRQFSFILFLLFIHLLDIRKWYLDWSV